MPIQPEALLAAANKVVVAQGVDALTLEAVAREAGVSKGGLLHHFPTKDALIVGMVQQVLNKFTAALNDELEKDSESEKAGHWVKAYVRASVLDSPEDIELYSSLLAAIVVNPELLKPIQDSWAEWQAKAESNGLKPEIATIIRLAVDGLALTSLFGFAPLEENLRSQVIETLLNLAQP
ncbi:MULTISPECIES: TetR/AcrR family transcriptional regulator [unclassified Microcoleus]|jgi:AcrR family transcriptional regulator|uniref:TetR/AcrR family transcriptional regulator n=1 Tax=unclassified Microcoleus TaxID=2642155 RepID=UPI001D5D3EAB|nr:MULTISPECIES: TetR/AcrR family transcriptional regulator [unclassified Microcoleus]MCC3506335.1 TetR family transcriptional regulator [Microcoleus sp. PH2017_19_SFW_U_A]MCC3415000.1 TetR family transcriptional regulator [Microcoleus sp. PH2017_02_FOX_O_A]MCC3494155.1 TetR family transcriptional regulator [Microcoleus sp. PH2017_16_JOR_D_A]MCC3519129.1 TetR family transcriptional regulator [Microcoleus sp. PH2017_18_LLB_O_A]MCC3523193.1 TetR family transcriptional regulator [Microcoleus sp. 